MHKSVNGIKIGDKYKDNTCVYTVCKIYNSRKGYFSEIYLTLPKGHTIKVFVGKKESKNLIGSLENNPHLTTKLELIP